MQERRVIDLAVDRSSPPRVLSPERHEGCAKSPLEVFLGIKSHITGHLYAVVCLLCS